MNVKDFVPGDLVVSTRPEGRYLPIEERSRIGLVVCHVPAHTQDNTSSITLIRVAWTGPNPDRFLTLEPDCRLKVI